MTSPDAEVRPDDVAARLPEPRSRGTRAGRVPFPDVPPVGGDGAALVAALAALVRYHLRATAPVSAPGVEPLAPAA